MGIVRCEKCFWWDDEIPKGLFPHRTCKNPKLKSDGNPPYNNTAGVDDGYGVIQTGPEFGCIHGEDKNMSICRYARIGQPYGFRDEFVHDAESASDVYMFETIGGGIECQNCKLGDHTVTLAGYKEAIDHLLAHRAAGHAVPESAIERCKSNIL